MHVHTEAHSSSPCSWEAVSCQAIAPLLVYPAIRMLSRNSLIQFSLLISRITSKTTVPVNCGPGLFTLKTLHPVKSVAKTACILHYEGGISPVWEWEFSPVKVGVPSCECGISPLWGWEFSPMRVGVLPHESGSSPLVMVEFPSWECGSSPLWGWEFPHDSVGFFPCDGGISPLWWWKFPPESVGVLPCEGGSSPL